MIYKEVLDYKTQLQLNELPQISSFILTLKTALSETDFMIFKCYEASLSNEPMPYNLEELLAERKSWRKQINELEELLEIKSLEAKNLLLDESEKE